MVLGVCGKIASGKSEFLRLLGKRDWLCIDADQVVDELYKKGEKGQKRIEELFGREYLNLDGGVNKSKLRDLVYADLNKLKVLNEAIHPLVVDRIAEFLSGVDTSRSNSAIAASYFESGGLADLVDDIVWIERDQQDIEKVLVDERDFSKEMAKRVIDLIGKPKGTSFVIKNNNGLDDLEHEAESLIDSLLFS